MRIAVVGSGIAGAGAAWLLAQHHRVTLYEADNRLGGHANTVEVASEAGPIPIDTGFIVYNERNYPHLVALFDHLGVATEPSDMSFAVSLKQGAYEYSGSGLGGLFGQRANLVRPAHWRMIVDLIRFYKNATGYREILPLERMTLGDLLTATGYSQHFAKAHIVPMAAAIWSTPTGQILDFPASSFVNFFDNHGLFKLGAGRPAWRTVSDGSRDYVARLNADFHRLGGETRLGCPVRAVAPSDEGPILRAQGSEEARYDAIVLACHGDTALSLFSTPDDRQAKILSAFCYAENRAILHSDSRFMPSRPRLWSSWNFQGDGGDAALTLTYWMNRLQNIGGDEDYFVSLNPVSEPRRIHYETRYTHPIFTPEALAAQNAIADIQGVDGIYYCGAHLRYGFHEDGLGSAVGVAERLGSSPPWQQPAPSRRAA